MDDFDLDFYESALLGYFSLPNASLSCNEIFYLPYSIRLITFELGIRFISDYFRGNIYFETIIISYPFNLNLVRSSLAYGKSFDLLA